MKRVTPRSTATGLTMFTHDDMVRLLRASPFIPFRLHLSDGGHVDVRHQELANAGRQYAFVGLPAPAQPDPPFDRHTLVYYMHVTRYELLRPGQAPSDGAPPQGPQAPAGMPA